MESTTQQYCLRWNNHRTNLLSVFEELLANEAFTDVTLAVESGSSIKCHKMVLAACSSYFQRLFADLPCKHPIVVLKDVKHGEIKAILEYMYRGEVNVAQDQLAALLRVAEVLKVKGLVDEHVSGTRSEPEIGAPETTSASPPPAISTSTATSSTAAQTTGPASLSPAPHSTDNSYNYLYGRHRAATSCHENPPLPIWPISSGPSSVPQASTHRRSTSDSSSSPRGETPSRVYEDDCETTTSTCKRRYPGACRGDTPILRTVLGQGHADSSQTCRARAAHVETIRQQAEATRRGGMAEPAHSSHLDVRTNVERDDEKINSPQCYVAEQKAGTLPYGSSQKPEWKRYKQYTREDMMSAIETVKSGMSPLQAARKFGVPPRTLYDKVKKMGIATSRPLRRAATSAATSYPYGVALGNANGAVYGPSLYEATSRGDVATCRGLVESAYVKWREATSIGAHQRQTTTTTTTKTILGRTIGREDEQQHHDEDDEDEDATRDGLDRPKMIEREEMAEEEEGEELEEEEEEEEVEAQVEDLSVNRRTQDLRAIAIVKEESNVSSENYANN